MSGLPWTNYTRRAAACVATLTLWTPAFAAELRYTVTDLGVLNPSPPGAFSSAHSVSGGGAVVGDSTVMTTRSRAFLYAGGSMTDLGTTPFGSGSRAWSINSIGSVVVGEVYTGASARAFRYQAGVMTELPSFGGPYTIAYGVNDAGHVVGISDTVETARRGFVYDGQQMTDIGVLPGGFSAIPTSINNGGTIVGHSYVGTRMRAFVRDGQGMRELPALGPGESRALGVNDHGVAVGYAAALAAGGELHATIYEPGRAIDIGALFPSGGNSAARAINNLGEVVGDGPDESVGGRPFIYRSGVLEELNALIDPAAGWSLRTAFDINDSGQIVGWGLHGPGKRAYLLTPIPEPSGAVCALGVFALAGRPRRRAGCCARLPSDGRAVHARAPSSRSSSSSSLFLPAANPDVIGGATGRLPPVLLNCPSGPSA
jgi:probable HAF family extracellular repeat protein